MMIFHEIIFHNNLIADTWIKAGLGFKAGLGLSFIVLTISVLAMTSSISSDSQNYQPKGTVLVKGTS